MSIDSTGKDISIEMEANEDGALYGAITQKLIVDGILDSYGVKLTPDSVIAQPIRKLGEYEIQIQIRR